MSAPRDVPVAVPFATLNPQPSSSARPMVGPEAPTTLARSAVFCRTPQKGVGVGGARQSGERLSERDQAILDSLKALRLLSARQVERLHFLEGSALTQARRARKTLARLHEAGLLHRLERRVGGTYGGSSGFIYGLSAGGQRLMRASGPAGGTRRRRPWEPSAMFQDHVLAVSELFVHLKEAERSGRLELLDFVAEPYCWRGFTGAGGSRTTLKPDAFVALARGEFEQLTFVEVDLGTEGPATLRSKLETYLDHARSGVEQARHGVYPRVVFLAPDEARVRKITETLKPTLRRTPELCAVGRNEDAIEVLTGERP